MRFVPEEPPLPEAPDAWAAACVYGPTGAPAKPDPGPKEAARRELLQLMQALARTPEEGWRERLRHVERLAASAQLQALDGLHDALLSRIDQIQRRIPVGSSLGDESLCYRALMDHLNAISLPRDQRTIEKTPLGGDPGAAAR